MPNFICVVVACVLSLFISELRVGPQSETVVLPSFICVVVVCVLSLFISELRVGLQFETVVFPGHTYKLLYVLSGGLHCTIFLHISKKRADFNPF